MFQRNSKESKYISFSHLCLPFWKPWISKGARYVTNRERKWHCCNKESPVPTWISGKTTRFCISWQFLLKQWFYFTNLEFIPCFLIRSLQILIAQTKAQYLRELKYWVFIFDNFLVRHLLYLLVRNVAVSYDVDFDVINFSLHSNHSSNETC